MVRARDTYVEQSAGRARVIIEGVKPEIDSSRLPAKCRKLRLKRNILKILEFTSVNPNQPKNRCKQSKFYFKLLGDSSEKVN